MWARLLRLVRRLDRVASGYETAAGTETGTRELDYVLSLLLCLWVVIEIGILARYLQLYPLF